MANPIEGIFLDGQYYQIESGSHRITIPVANSSNNTHSGRTFTVTGTRPDSHSFTLTLNNRYVVKDVNNATLGLTTFAGVSQLSRLRSLANFVGESLPFTFIDSAGVSYGVVITNPLDVSPFRDVLQPDGAEYKVNITLDSYQ